ncbi:hypothetical protein HanPI659440_Chr09g0360911 [Helianthus annuus]|uniref:Uncharacterized protein n=1 Tax=Helianthus annuus TaxID=4232 RepID=A0A9K3NBJ3_HELAN|nr:hypothetical protein HanXRQr2_Chr09g0418011 [Helianthus annuus]KAJ0537258.1 hypothetical protein HanIR_Chr09g0450631 [Helianthus annuus]KAJ0755714.1 hypothetical protein HanPI659440_Chr09g0360911 [Helianthus annuus]
MSAGIPPVRLLKPRLRTWRVEQAPKPWGMSPVKSFKEKSRMSKPGERVQMEGGMVPERLLLLTLRAMRLWNWFIGPVKRLLERLRERRVGGKALGKDPESLL